MRIAWSFGKMPEIGEVLRNAYMSAPFSLRKYVTYCLLGVLVD
jgi:hypothetical protein